MAIKRIGVVGSGIMGSGVAEVAAASGFEVVLRSRSQQGADAMLAGLDASLARQVKKGRARGGRRAPRSAPGSRAVTDLAELAGCDLVLESIVEDLATKQELFAELDRVCAPDAILATNTSTLPIVDMAVITERPDRVCGIHFFNPAPRCRWSRWSRPSPRPTRRSTRRATFVAACGKTAVDGEGPGWLRGQRAAVPVPQQRGAALRRRGRVARRHRHRHEGRVQLPDGSARAARSRRARHQPRDPRRPLRGVPRSRTSRPPRCCAAWSPPIGSGGRRAPVSTTTSADISVGPPGWGRMRP